MAHTNNLYTVYDRRAAYYLNVFTARADADAHRIFAEAVISSETPVSQYPADFDLVRIGAIDLESGVLTPQYPPHLLINGLVTLENAERERSRYQTVLSTIQQEEPLPEAL